MARESPNVVNSKDMLAYTNHQSRGRFAFISLKVTGLDCQCQVDSGIAISLGVQLSTLVIGCNYS